MPSRSANNHRYVPDAVRDYDLNPAASVVDKQSKYTPQVGDAERLKQTAQGLSRLAKGINDASYVWQKQANEHMVEAVANTEEKNRKDWAEVSKNIDGMAKFNPYNKEAYRTLRAKANMEEGIYNLAELEASCEDLTYEEFTAQKNQIINNTVNNMNAEGLKAKHTANYLTKLQDQSFRLTDKYITKKAEKDYQILQNQIISSTSKDIATLTYLNPDGYIEGWNEAVKKLEEVADSVGMNATKKKELLDKTINQYLMDNIDDIEAEEFMIALSQTTIGGKPLSDYDPNYATSMKQLLIKAKGAKYESDAMDLKIEKLRLEKASLAANAELFSFLSDPNKTDAEILNKANELIEAGGMEAIGMDYLKKVAGDKATLLNLRTTQTNPEAYEELMRKFLTNELTQQDILTAVDNKELGARDADSLYKALQSKANETYSEQLAALKELYLDTNATVDLGEDKKSELTKSVYNTISDQNLTKAEKAEALTRIKGVAEYMESEKVLNESKDPSKLLTSAYMRTQRVETQTKEDAQRHLAKMGFLKNQGGWSDKDINIVSPMQQERMVTIVDDKGKQQTVNRPHYGTDIGTYTGRQIYSPVVGKVVASGFESSMGNYLLIQSKSGSYIKLMHLQYADLPKVGTQLKIGTPIGHVGSTGAVEDKSKGCLHIEFFDKRMKLVTAEQFSKGK